MGFAELGSVILMAIVAGVGAYFGSYLRKKGESRALKEGLSTLVRQQEEIRLALQHIEHVGWVMQQRWQLKREVIWGLIESVNKWRVAQVKRRAGVELGEEHISLAESMSTQRDLCRAVLDERNLQQFEHAIEPIQEIRDQPIDDRIANAKLSLTRLQSLARSELFPQE